MNSCTKDRPAASPGRIPRILSAAGLSASIKPPVLTTTTPSCRLSRTPPRAWGTVIVPPARCPSASSLSVPGPTRRLPQSPPGSYTTSRDTIPTGTPGRRMAGPPFSNTCVFPGSTCPFRSGLFFTCPARTQGPKLHPRLNTVYGTMCDLLSIYSDRYLGNSIDIDRYFYTPGCGGEHAERFLKGFDGILQVDGYAGCCRRDAWTPISAISD